jgi:hypothetical protein
VPYAEREDWMSRGIRSFIKKYRINFLRKKAEAFELDTFSITPKSAICQDEIPKP